MEIRIKDLTKIFPGDAKKNINQDLPGRREEEHP